MKPETDILDGILDIALPLASIDSSWGLYTIIAMMATLGIIFIGIGYHWWKTPRQRCRRELRELLHQYKYGHIDSRNATFRLAEILRERMHCCQLSIKAGLPKHLHHYQSRWYSFINELDAARYSGVEIEETLFGRLANEASFWLRRW